ncbi:MAG: sulfur reduction protein DsrS [Gammaproteobacteria bacterium]|nr:sulfur reduction protein DsrS [Gammaproteobacteria bacterium]
MISVDLTPEDALRINVLLASQIEAIRLDESRMTLFALSQKGEAKVKLNPNCRDDSYLRKVRETLSSHVLGSPGGYPVYLKRWTRMGQARDEVLESLLMLGEPEAVVAVVNATGITDELARRAWWASQTSDNARCMLQQAAVVNGEMGPVLADFLIEFLPFEEDASSQIKTVSLVLQSDLVAEDVRTRLWEKGRLKNAYLVGFMQTLPDALPVQCDAHPGYQAVSGKLSGLLAADNPFAVQLCRLLSPAGQAYLDCMAVVLKKPSNQDVMVELMHAMAAYSCSLPVTMPRKFHITDVARLSVEPRGGAVVDAEALEYLQALLEALPDGENYIHAMLFLAMLAEPLLDPVFSRTDAIGTVMRKKLQPVTEPINEQIRILRNA